MVWELVSPVILKLIERVFPDKAQQDKAKAELLTIQAEAAAKEMAAKSDVVVAEAKGESAAQRNWRPHLMYTFMFIIIFNFIFSPIMAMFGVVVPILPIPENMWTLLSIGVGGYIAGRSAEKIARQKFNYDAFFSTYKKQKGPLTQSEVDSLNDAIASATNGR